MVVHMTFNHLCRSSTLLYPNKWPYVNGRQIDFQSNSVDSSSTGHIFITISNLIGKELVT